jgi:hypothetical protein
MNKGALALKSFLFWATPIFDFPDLSELVRQIYKNKFVISLNIETYDNDSEEGHKPNCCSTGIYTT